MGGKLKLPDGPPEVEERFDITDLAKQWRQIGWNISELKQKIQKEERNRVRISKLISSMLVTYDDVQLSRREKEVMETFCGAKMKTNKEIAVSLNVSERAIKFHISHLLLKYAVATRYDLYLRYKYLRMIGPIGDGAGNDILTLEDTHAA